MSAKASEVDQKLGDSKLGQMVAPEGYSTWGHTSTLSLTGGPGPEAVVEWLKSEDGLPLTISQKGCLTVGLYTQASGTAFLYEEWATKADQDAYLAVRGERKEAGKDKETEGVVLSLEMLTEHKVLSGSSEADVAFTCSLQLDSAEGKSDELATWAASDDGVALMGASAGLVSMKTFKKGDTSLWLWQEWDSKASFDAYMELGPFTKMVEAGTLASEAPLITEYTHVETYKTQPPSAEPAAEPEAEPEAEPGAEPGDDLGLPPKGEAPTPS
eukprot:COSAG01_NODE_37_length_34085_cov_64.376626_39_plen_271_part_00